MRQISTVLILCICLSKLSAREPIQLFQAYWESELSYLFNDDEINNPWHIDLGDIDVGPLGYQSGPHMVTIASADYCVHLCQEEWEDEFCTDYPPEGVPNRPRVVDDWGTKYNITSAMIRKGVRSIHQRGGKVILAYGGALETEYHGRLVRTGITAASGGGNFAKEEPGYATQLAYRIHKNIQDWDLDGVDFFFAGNYDVWDAQPGYNVLYHMAVISNLRERVGSSKTISYSTIRSPFPYDSFTHEAGVIAACHTYLDYINMPSDIVFNHEALAQLQRFGVPFSKVGVLLEGVGYESERVREIVNLVKEMGMSGINLFSINKENEEYRGEYAKMIAKALYDNDV